MRRLLVIAGVLAFGSIIAIAVGVSNQTRLSGIEINPGGDYGMNVSQSGGTATLITGLARTFHLEQDANANGYRIASVLPGAAAGEGFVYKQAISSADLTGQFPNVTLTNPLVSKADSVGIASLNAGECDEGGPINLPGAVVGGTAYVTATDSSFGDGIVASARVSAANEVTIRRCSFVDGNTASFNLIVVGAVP
jgi:hypothetical protein